MASLAVRDLLRGARRHGKILAALPHAIYLEFADTAITRGSGTASANSR